MKLADLPELLHTGKFSLIRAYPEVGREDELLGNVFDILVKRRDVVVLASPTAGSGEPCRSYGFSAFEVMSTNGGALVTEAIDWPVTTWRLRKLESPEDIELWDREHDVYDDVEDEVLEAAKEVFADLAARPAPPEPSQLSAFDYVRWSVLTEDGWTPAGAVAVKSDQSGLAVDSFGGSEADAHFWETRYTFVPEGFLRDINQASGRDEMFSEPTSIKAASLEEALERAKYQIAKEHYEQTGRSLF